MVMVIAKIVRGLFNLILKRKTGEKSQKTFYDMEKNRCFFALSLYLYYIYSEKNKSSQKKKEEGEWNQEGDKWWHDCWQQQ